MRIFQPSSLFPCARSGLAIYQNERLVYCVLP